MTLYQVLSLFGAGGLLVGVFVCCSPRLRAFGSAYRRSSGRR